jgi:hypothetical protein
LTASRISMKNMRKHVSFKRCLYICWFSRKNVKS